MTVAELIKELEKMPQDKVIGCSHLIKPNETIKECLDRMIVEKEF